MLLSCLIFLSVCLCVPDTSEYWTRWALHLHSLPGGEEGHSRAACEGELDFTKWQNVTHNWNVFGAQFLFCVVYSKSHPLKNYSCLFLSQIPGSMTAAELVCEVLDRRNIMVKEKEYWSCWEISDKEEMGEINWKTVLLLSSTSTFVILRAQSYIYNPFCLESNKGWHVKFTQNMTRSTAKQNNDFKACETLSTQPAVWPTRSDTNSRRKRMVFSNVTEYQGLFWAWYAGHLVPSWESHRCLIKCQSTYMADCLSMPRKPTCWLQEDDTEERNYVRKRMSDRKSWGGFCESYVYYRRHF